MTSPPDDVGRVFQTRNLMPNWQSTWNMAPTQLGPVVRRHPTTGERNLDLLRWGLLPHWVRGDPKKVRQPINARAETVATAPMFRDAFRARRCIVPIDGFYEWQVLPGAKQPHAVARADGAMMALAGIWEGWRGEGDEVVRSYAVITTTAIDALGHLHERMPVVLEPEDWAAWLGEADGDPATLLRPSGAAFRVWPVSTRVNNVRNNGPDLIEPVAGPQEAGPQEAGVLTTAAP